MGVKIYNPVDLKDIDEFKRKFYGKEVTDTKKYEEVKKEVEDSNRMTSEANIELLEQVNKIQEQVTNAMVEIYELLGQGQGN